MTLDEFNKLSVADAIAQLYSCCHCNAWAETVEKLRPFTDIEKLFYAAQTLWQQATEAQILEAFSGHARIGDIALLRSRYAGRATAEQGQVLEASEAVLQELHQLNIDYEARYGFIFIVCASGKSADEMLALLKARINNGRAIELLNGAAAQGEITRLRLQQLFNNPN
jgi:2-oxo-4-hydroxy-4-carboxy-5-ureidoimidazoline decarboxylase